MYVVTQKIYDDGKVKVEIEEKVVNDLHSKKFPVRHKGYDLYENYLTSIEEVGTFVKICFLTKLIAIG
jgi:hypothetical protein